MSAASLPELLLMHELEQAAFSAWPALEEHDLQGWRLRFSHGYTKRANSANALAAADTLPPVLQQQVEAFYQARSLPTVFRLASFCTSAAVDAILARDGYMATGLSLVMTLSLEPHANGGHGAQACELLAWFDGMLEITGESAQDHQAHWLMLGAIRVETKFFLHRVGGRAACCGFGVLTGDYLGIFELRTHPDFRGCGLATQLCRDLIDWATSRGARIAFLQVVADNASAIRLYDKLGFVLRYRYWYRVQQAAEAGG